MAGAPELKTTAVTSNGRQGRRRLGHRRPVGDANRRASRSPPIGTGDDGTADGVQRLLVGDSTARWTYSSADVTFRPYRQGVRAAVIVETFAWHASRSVQHTLYAIADVVLATYQEIADITLALHERPYRPADMFSAGIENPDDLFVALEEPLGVVEVTVERSDNRESLIADH